jgi:parallel beta-helix repeat protein
MAVLGLVVSALVLPVPISQAADAQQTSYAQQQAQGTTGQATNMPMATTLGESRLAAYRNTSTNTVSSPSSKKRRGPAPTPTPTTAPAPTPNPTPTPTPMPTSTARATATPTPSLIPTPTPTAKAPTPTPSGPAFTTIQAAVDAAPAGATITVPPGVYRESVRIAKPLTLNGYGAIIDGRDAAGNLVRATWLSVSANDVTVRGFTMRYANGTYATGSVENTIGVQRFRLEDCDLGWSYVNLNLTGAIDSVVKNCSIHDAKHLGVRVSAPSPTTNRGLRNQLVGNRIFHNDRVGEPDPQADGGNLKATGQDYLVMDGNEVYDGPKGLWLDVWCRNSTYSNNRIHDNDGPGIHDETSTGSKIYNNVVWRNGALETWGWGAGILVAASKDSEVYGNTLAWNQVGISFISQNRGDDPGMTGNYSHDNFVAAANMAAGQDHFGSFWAYDYTASILYLPSSNNRGLNDRFYYANPDGSSAPENQYPRFIWDGYRTAASFRTTAGGQGASYVAQTDATTILTAAGLPLKP